VILNRSRDSWQRERRQPFWNWFDNLRHPDGVLDFTATLTDKAQYVRASDWEGVQEIRTHADQFHANGKSINEKVRLYARIGEALIAGAFPRQPNPAS
jgi:hypothetical protein